LGRTNRHEIHQRDRTFGGLKLGVRISVWSATGEPVRLPRDPPAPCFGVPSSAAKQGDESKRGQQSQSIEPSRPTSAALWQSPISA
jgi:hypothetical protein